MATDILTQKAACCLFRLFLGASTALLWVDSAEVAQIVYI
jgi:hypothetical protein